MCLNTVGSCSAATVAQSTTTTLSKGRHRSHKYADTYDAFVVCLQASEYKVPIYITETGIADRSDANRATMIDKYMRAVS